MAHERWKPSVTVAAVVERAGRFLLVEEDTPDGVRLNNPAGHLDPGESPLEAVVRETLEETAHPLTALAIVGLYLSRFTRPARGEDVTYLRIAFAGTVGEAIAGRALDAPIRRTLWLTPEEMHAEAARMRSPLVLRCLDDFIAGRRFPLDLLHADRSLYDPETRS
jgi:8-oxo-dGTP pyrophosphatase MutT (NUDIX family)